MTRPSPQTHLAWMRAQEKRLVAVERRAASKGGGGGVGTPGPPGTDGKPGLVWKGPWAVGTTYAVGDAVSYVGTNAVASSYIAVAAGAGHTPPEGTSDAFWQMLAQEGAPGPKGDPGAGSTAAPVGAVFQFAGAAAPTGYLLCDGQAVSRTTYASLFAVVGSAYGAGDGSSTFNVPNMKGRVPAGLDAAQTEFNTLGEVGGSKTHTHTGPAHTHTIPNHTHTLPSHAHQLSANGWAQTRISSGSASMISKTKTVTSWTADVGNTFAGSSNASSTASSVGTTLDGATDSGGTGDTGTGGAGDTGSSGTGTTGSGSSLAPYLVLNFIIKAT